MTGKLIKFGIGRFESFFDVPGFFYSNFNHEYTWYFEFRPWFRILIDFRIQFSKFFSFISIYYKQIAKNKCVMCLYYHHIWFSSEIKCTTNTKTHIHESECDFSWNKLRVHVQAQIWEVIVGVNACCKFLWIDRGFFNSEQQLLSYTKLIVEVFFYSLSPQMTVGKKIDTL